MRTIGWCRENGLAYQSLVDDASAGEMRRARIIKTHALASHNAGIKSGPAKNELKLAKREIDLRPLRRSDFKIGVQRKECRLRRKFDEAHLTRIRQRHRDMTISVHQPRNGLGFGVEQTGDA